MTGARISMTEVARRLRVTPPAVSNWRRRHPSFPRVEKVNGQELVGVEELARWLDSRKISKDDLREGELPGATYGARFRKASGLKPELSKDALWQELMRLRGANDVAEFADDVLGALCDFPRPGSPDPAVIRLADQIRQSSNVADVFEFLLDRFASVDGRRDATVHTPPSVVRLLVELADPEPGGTVFDPSCGSGGFLVGAAKHVAKKGGQASYTGHTFSKRSADLTAMNARLHGITVNTTIVTTGGLPLPDRSFDRILTNPPFDIKGHRVTVGWLQHLTWRLADDGRAAVIMPGSTLFSEGTEKTARTQLIERGFVEAIVTLPSQLFATTAIPVTAWLVSRARNRPEQILLIDASKLGHSISRTRRSLSTEDIGRVVDAVDRWRSGDLDDLSEFAESVPVPHIQGNDYVLTPARYLRPNVRFGTGTVRELHDELERLAWRAREVDEVVARKLEEGSWNS